MKLPDAFSADVMAELARPVTRFDPRHAEMVSNIVPKWHVVETWPHRERKVAAELAARRFGIFVPESEQTVVERGRKIERRSLMFPGYVFVFVWDVLKHRDRIEAVEGVMRLVLITGEDPDNPLPAELSDEEIDEIRAVENGERPLFTQSRKKGRRKGKRAFDNDVVGVHAWSPFQDRLLTLDSEGRNQILRTALGLS